MAPPTAALGFAPDRALRARTAALLIDGVILGLVTRLATNSIDDFGTAALVGVLILFGYFFLLEAATGAQTIGKRAARLRVVQLDGQPPTTQQIAIRNALRIVDALPLLYASGLVAVMWSGPGLRQRLGDKVAGTAVILEPGAKPRPTPGWLLPTLTVASVLLSTVGFGLLYREYRTPAVGENSLAPAPVAGFPGDNTQPPGVGTYTARAFFNGVPVVDATRTPIVGSWEITKHCNGAACTYGIVRRLPGEKDLHGDLVPAVDGWHVVFATHAFRAKCPVTQKITTVRQRESIVIHFDPGGRSAVAHQSNAFRADGCLGDIAREVDWTATLPTF